MCLNVSTVTRALDKISPILCKMYTYYRFQLRGDLFFGYDLLNGTIDQDETWTPEVSACDLIFHNILL